MSRTNLDKAEQMARDALEGKLRGDLPSWYWPEGTLGLVEEVRDLRHALSRLLKATENTWLGDADEDIIPAQHAARQLLGEVET